MLGLFFNPMYQAIWRVEYYNQGERGGCSESTPLQKVCYLSVIFAKLGMMIAHLFRMSSSSSLGGVKREKKSGATTRKTRKKQKRENEDLSRSMQNYLVRQGNASNNGCQEAIEIHHEEQRNTRVVEIFDREQMALVAVEVDNQEKMAPVNR